MQEEKAMHPPQRYYINPRHILDEAAVYGAGTKPPKVAVRIKKLTYDELLPLSCR